MTRIKSERGAALLEAAITLPMLLLVAVGIFEFGRAYQTWQILTNAAREGARIAVLPAPTNGNVETRVREYMAAGQLSEYGHRRRRRESLGVHHRQRQRRLGLAGQHRLSVQFHRASTRGAARRSHHLARWRGGDARAGSHAERDSVGDFHGSHAHHSRAAPGHRRGWRSGLRHLSLHAERAGEDRLAADQARRRRRHRPRARRPDPARRPPRRRVAGERDAGRARSRRRTRSSAAAW